jgi:hypothetical protein
VEGGERPCLVRLKAPSKKKKKTPPDILPGGVSLSQPSAMAGYGANSDYCNFERFGFRSRSGDRLPVPGWTEYSD